MAHKMLEKRAKETGKNIEVYSCRGKCIWRRTFNVWGN
jgi:hypothetical protein